MIGRLLHAQQGGVGIILVLAFMVLAVPITTGALTLAGNLSTDSLLKSQTVQSQYGSLGGNQYGLYRLLYEPGYAVGLAPGVPDVDVITVNGDPVTVTVEKLADVPGGGSQGPAVLQASKLVNPATAPADTLTTYTYTITVQNQGSDPEPLYRIRDGLPPDFSYVNGSTTGVTTADPGTWVFGDYTWLVWDVTSLNIELAPSASVQLTFQAQANVPEGNYCNTTWVEPGGGATGSGPTAKIVVGSPVGVLCENEEVLLTKSVTPEVVPGNTLTTFTYTITLENAGSSTQELFWLRDVLPPGFSYVPGSTSGDITTSNPFTWTSGGRQNLNWLFFFGYDIDPAEVKTLTFDAQASLVGGFYDNEVWASFDVFSYTAYSYPTATVTVFDVFEVSDDDGLTTSKAEVWLEDDEYTLSGWDVVN